MIKLLSASIAATTLLAVGLYVLGTETEVMARASQVVAKGDRLNNRPIETMCGDWPYYHHACLRDPRNSDGRARKARIVSRTKHRHPTFLGLLSN